MNKVLRVAVVLVTFLSFTWLESHAAPPPPRVSGPAPYRPGPKPKNIPPKKHVYVVMHDLNKDRVVDIKDTLIWMERNKDGFTSVLVKKDNAGLLEVVDMNNDGKITKDEFVQFFRIYDVNGDNVLDIVEIEKVKTGAQ